MPITSVATVRVRAKNELIAKHIQHRPSGIKFRDGVANWPNDQFTKRRIRDGDASAPEQERIIRSAPADGEAAAS